MKCFVVSPIGEEHSETRRRSDKVLNHLIRPACDNFDVLRADEIRMYGDINSDIINNLENADLVIANISEENLNVYFEIGYRLALNKPLVLIKDKNISNNPAFDLFGKRYCTYSMEIDEIEGSIEELRQFISNTMRHKGEKFFSIGEHSQKLEFVDEGENGWSIM